MVINGKQYKVEDTFDSIITIPDCFVYRQNKLGTGNGEAKLYWSSKKSMREFFGDEGFSVDCIILKSDLLTYMLSLENEYKMPSQNYMAKDKFSDLWKERMEHVNSLPDVIHFKMNDQIQIDGPRGYVNSKDEGYQIIRELSLPLVSYISAMRIRDNGTPLFYLKLFVDYDIIEEKKNGPLVFNYGKKQTLENNAISSKTVPRRKDDEIRRSRDGQGKYRDQLLLDCPYCPITMLNDERLLIASHIKPWAVSNDKEKIDPKNGFMLSPLYDKLFDRGFITFTEDKHMKISNWLSQMNIRRLGLKEGLYVPRLPLDEQRNQYLEYHRKIVFKG